MTLPCYPTWALGDLTTYTMIYENKKIATLQSILRYYFCQEITAAAIGTYHVLLAF